MTIVVVGSQGDIEEVIPPRATTIHATPMEGEETGTDMWAMFAMFLLGSLATISVVSVAGYRLIK